MESAIGTVSSVAEGTATLMVAAPIACHRCAAGKGCGAGLLGTNEKPRRLETSIPAGMTLAVGDRVRLTVAPRHLLRAAILAYGLPLISMLAFVAIAWGFGAADSDLLAFGFAVTGLLAGLLLSRRLLAAEAACEQFVPVIEGLAGAADA
jgi:sigma-E factor negative regulatory protein RseC